MLAYDLVERFSAKGLQYGWNLVPIELDTGNFYEQSQYIKSNVIKNILMYATNEDVLVEVVDTVSDMSFTEEEEGLVPVYRLFLRPGVTIISG